MRIVKKIDPGFFEDIKNGKKDFEIRIADFAVKEGDELVLVEHDENRKLTGREIVRKVKYVLRTKDCKFYKKEDIDKYGFVVMGLD